jgi:hypothetical protein
MDIVHLSAHIREKKSPEKHGVVTGTINRERPSEARETVDGVTTGVTWNCLEVPRPRDNAATEISDSMPAELEIAV